MNQMLVAIGEVVVGSIAAITRQAAVHIVALAGVHAALRRHRTNIMPLPSPERVDGCARALQQQAPRDE